MELKLEGSSDEVGGVSPRVDGLAEVGFGQLTKVPDKPVALRNMLRVEPLRLGYSSREPLELGMHL